MSEERVYRVHSAAERWHWPDPSLRWLASACSSFHLFVQYETDPAEVPADGRCRGKGCRERWARYDAGQTA